MKNSTRVLATASAAAMMLSLAACGNGGNPTPSGGESGSGSQTYTIGICQLVQHPALDQATLGFKTALEETLGEANVKFDEQNANNDPNTCSTIINSFVSSNVDLILANATAPLQAAASGTDTIPVIGTSVTDYATALDIDNWTGTTGRNISGTSDLAPLEEQAAMIQELFPDAENVSLLYCSGEPNSLYQVELMEGYLTEIDLAPLEEQAAMIQELFPDAENVSLLYCSGEPNSLYQVELMEGYLTEMGYTCERFSFTDSNDVAQVTQTACASSDVLYIPTDNTAAANTELIANVVLPAKVPAIVGEQGICAGCGVATLSIDYYDIGYQAGLMAYDILANGADITTMEIQSAPTQRRGYHHHGDPVRSHCC